MSWAMPCPNCAGQRRTQVLDSRGIQAGIRRRRLCLGCKERFTTYELRVSGESADRTKVPSFLSAEEQQMLGRWRSMTPQEFSAISAVLALIDSRRPPIP